MKWSNIYTAVLAGSTLLHTSSGQQFAGDVIPNNLPTVGNSEIAFWRIKDPAGKAKRLTLINYFSMTSKNVRLDPTRVKRAVIFVHGLNRDPSTYMSQLLSALVQATPGDPSISFDSVQLIAPYFPNGEDKDTGYPWTADQKANRGSQTNVLVWPGSQWSAGANNQYPHSTTTVSSFEVIDQIINYFGNKTMYPNLNQIVIGGHSMGAQFVNRYAEIAPVQNTTSPLIHWIGNPNSYAWMSTSRPLNTASCSIYDVYREGYTNFTEYPMTYATDLVAQGRSAIVANYNMKTKAYARGIRDFGNTASNCAPYTTGNNRNERFFNFIKSFPPVCSKTAGQCDTVDYVNSGHDAGVMMASPAGLARLFYDNFHGNNNRSYDFGYPRRQAGDDPFPNPTINTTVFVDRTVYAGNMTFAGCWSDGSRGLPSLSYVAYNNQSNSINLCTSACASKGYTIAGMEYGTYCYCGKKLNAYAQQVLDSGCTASCPGNSSQTCGQNNRLTLYANGIPAQIPIPTMPENVGNYASLLCYTEASSGRALTAKQYTDNVNMTLETCAKFCSGYKYFGTEYSSECYCGSYFNNGSVVASALDCTMPCSGDPTELCGAAGRLSVYVLADNSPVSTIIQSPPVPTTTSKVSSPATPVITATSQCPATNQTTITYRNSGSYLISCGFDTSSNAYKSVNIYNSYLDCITVCELDVSCIAFVYVGSSTGSGSGVCYLKGGNSPYIKAADNLIVGFKIPANNLSPTLTMSSTSMITSASATSLRTVLSSNTTPTGTILFTNANNTMSRSISSTSSPLSTFKITTNSSLSFQSTSISLLSLSSTSHTRSLETRTSSSFLSSTSSSSPSSTHTKTSNSSSMTLITSSSKTGSISHNTSTTISMSTSTIASTPLTITSPTFSIGSSTSHISLASTFSPSTHLSNSTRSTLTTTSTRTSSTLTLHDMITTTSSNKGSSLSSTKMSMTNSTTSYLSLISTSTISQTTVSSSSTLLGNTTLISTTSTSKATKISSTMSSSTTALPTTFTKLGCYSDSLSSRLLPIKQFNNAKSPNTNTPLSCAFYCRSSGYQFSGTEYGSECWCGRTSPSRNVSLSSSSCSSNCSGDARQSCGGPLRISIVKDKSWKPAVVARKTHTNKWTLMACYADTNLNRTIEHGLAPKYGGQANTTVPNCLDTCFYRGFKYCGLEYHRECYGGDTVPDKARKLSGDAVLAGCNTPCVGNQTESCGGVGKVLVYVNAILGVKH